MTYTIVYLPSRRMPKEVKSKQVDARDIREVLMWFVNTPEHDGDFVACIVECGSESVHQTLPMGMLENPFRGGTGVDA